MALVASIAFAIIGWRSARDRRNHRAFWISARRWPTAPGKILDAGIDLVTISVKDHGPVSIDTLYRPKVAYSYPVRGHVYAGSMFDCRDGAGETRASALLQISPYKTGNSADIAYDPDDPRISVLARARAPREIVDSALSMYLGYFGALFMFAMSLRILT